MSAEATGWVYRHSPFRGASFAIHHAIADSANDQHGYRLWMSMAYLGEKGRCDSGSARRAMKELVDGGFVELLRQGKGTTNEYRFLFPEATVVFETRGTPRTMRGVGKEPRASDATPPRTTRADPAHHARLTQENPTGQDRDPSSPAEIDEARETIAARQEQNRQASAAGKALRSFGTQPDHTDPTRQAFEQRLSRDATLIAEADETPRVDPEVARGVFAKIREARHRGKTPEVEDTESEKV